MRLCRSVRLEVANGPMDRKLFVPYNRTMQRSLLLLPLLLAPYLLAQSADLEATITGPAAARPDETFTAIGTVQNHGPDAAANVLVEMDVNGRPCPAERNIGTLAAGETRRFECAGSMPAMGSQVYSAVASLWVQSTTPDFVPGNNMATHWVRAITPPDLFVFTNGFPYLTPGLPFALPIRYGNRAEFPATGVTLTITTTAAFGKLPESCTVAADRAICSVAISDRPDQLVVELIAPDESAAPFDIRLEIDAQEEEAVPADNVQLLHAQNLRTFFVTSTADRGSGTLRAAIENANADCAGTIPCLIAFRIHPTAQAWSTIAPTSPLPRLLATHGILVDGTTQARYFANTNADGPEIEISGTLLREGNGLEIETGCVAQVQVRGLTINGFPGNGLQLGDLESCLQTPAFGLVEQNFIGTDPTGTRAVPNQRGIWMAMSRGRIEDNIVSGNERAGIFAARGRPVIERNRIGLTRELQPLGNGASGVYISAAASGSDVSDNYIGFNHHFGIGIAADATNVSARRNSLQANWQHAIDWGLDGATTTTPVPIPEITSVRYENGHTIIEGRGNPGGNWPPMFTLFASDAPDPSGYGEGQYFLGEVSIDYPSTDPHRFRLDWPGDLRGKWVTATATRFIFTGFLQRPGVRTNADLGEVKSTTSEFSRVWEVQ